MAHSKLYVSIMNSREWRELRTQVIREHPICQRCEQEGRVTASRCVHHIVPVESARTETEAFRLAFRRSNCMALCFECHAAIHKAERSHSKEVVQERTQQRLSTWAERLERSMNAVPKGDDKELKNA